jgi:YHS domain-containing protein/thiol-disulfide isomerase/thioredoxin
MRAALQLTLVGLLIASAPLPVLAQAGIPWLYSLPEAQQIARQHQRLLLIHFYSDTCPPCKKLEQFVFTNPDVHRAMASSYIPVKINGERARNIATQFQVDRWPMDVIADHQGRVLYKTVSPQDPARYIQLLNAVAADFRAANPPAQVADGGMPPAATNAAYAAAAYGNRPAAPQTAGYAPNGLPGPQRNAMQPAADPYAPRGPAAANSGSPAPPQAEMAYAGAPAAREQANGYASQYAPPPAPRTGLHEAGYDPRSAWSGPANNAHAAAPDASNPIASAPAVEQAPSRPAWQENRFVSNRGAENRQLTDRDVAEGLPRTPALDAASAAEGTPIGLDGFCPVTLQEQERWSKGDARWGAVHRGSTYLFLSQQHQQRFLSDPDRYSPVLSGLDPARYVDRGELVAGQRAHGMWFREKIYLFADEQSLDRFSQAPEFYAQRAHEIMATAGR